MSVLRDRRVMYREYRAQGRYGYIGIDEYHRDQEPVSESMGTCARTVLTGIRPQKLGRAIAEALQAAYDAGRADMARDLGAIDHE
jgi:hypothetical protein